MNKLKNRMIITQESYVNRQTARQLDGQIAMDGWMDGWMDEWMDGQME